MKPLKNMNLIVTLPCRQRLPFGRARHLKDNRSDQSLTFIVFLSVAVGIAFLLQLCPLFYVFPFHPQQVPNCPPVPEGRSRSNDEMSCLVPFCLKNREQTTYRKTSKNCVQRTKLSLFGNQSTNLSSQLNLKILSVPKMIDDMSKPNRSLGRRHWWHPECDLPSTSPPTQAACTMADGFCIIPQSMTISQ